MGNNITLPELHEKQKTLWNQAQGFINSDVEIYDKLMAELGDVNKQIERLETHEKIANQMRQPTSKPLIQTAVPLSRKTDEYSNAFMNYLKSGIVTNVLSIGTDSAGGFTVPEVMANELIVALTEQNVFRQIARVVNSSSEKLKVPIAVAAGIAEWVDENEEIPESDSTFVQVILVAHKLATMMRASSELLDDSAFNMQAYIVQEFARRIGAREEEAFCVGDGMNKPTGIFSAVGGTPVGVTTSTPDVITFDDVMDLYHSIKAPYRTKAVFLTHDSTIRELRKIKDSNGQYIWSPSVKEKTPDTILGKPVYTSPYVPEIAAGATPLAFGDFSYYWIADRRDIRFKVLNELYAKRDQIGFSANERIDGRLILPEAISLLKMGS